MLRALELDLVISNECGDAPFEYWNGKNNYCKRVRKIAIEVEKRLGFVTGPGRYFWDYPRPAPVRGPTPLIPWTVPCFSPPIFNGDPSARWAGRGPGRGRGQGMPKNTPCRGPLSGAGRGMGPGARVFRGPGAPVTNSRND